MTQRPTTVNNRMTQHHLTSVCLRNMGVVIITTIMMAEGRGILEGNGADGEAGPAGLDRVC